MSVVCLNCKARKIKCDKKKPACTNCEKSNVGHLCQYESPHWISRVTTSDGTPITVAAAAAAAAVNSNSSTFTVDNGSVTIEFLQNEVKRLKALVSDLGSTPKHELTAPVLNNITFNDTVDFYESFKSLIVKRSGMVELKPLSCGAHDYKDHYAMVMIGYFNLGIAFYHSKVVNETRPKKGNKKNRLDASVTQTLNLLGESDAPEVQKVVADFIKERLAMSDQVQVNFPNIGTEREKNSSNELKEKIEQSLPPRDIIKLYLKRFYDYIYPFFPFIHRDFFDKRLFTTVLKSPDNSSQITLNLEEKFDWVLIATLLVILRLTYVSFPDAEFIDDDEKILLNYPINPDFVSNSLACLASFKILRKTKLTIIQCLLFIRTYFAYAPEDGDGLELTQSEMLFGIIIQSAYTIGLNRDASFHEQMKQDKEFSNLWRKIWFGILEQDRFISAIAGYPCLINNNSYNVKIPDSDTSTNTQYNFIESIIASELQKSQPILKLYADLSNLINNVASSPKINEVLSILQQIKNYSNINYNLSKLEILTRNDKNQDLKSNVRNVHIIQHQIQSLSLTVTVYQDMSLYFESKDHYDVKKVTYFQDLALKTDVELSNIIYSYLKNGYQEYIDPNYLFLMNRYVCNACQRMLATFSSILSRLYHAKDMISRGISPGFNVVKLNIITEKLFKISTAFLVLLQNTLGKKYYLVFKASLKFKFFLRSLRKDGYKCIKDTVSFVNRRFPGDSSARCRLLERVQLQLDPEQLLTQLDNANNIITLVPDQLDEYLNKANNCKISSDNEYMDCNLIWEHSFKERTNEIDQFNYPTHDMNIQMGLQEAPSSNDQYLNGDHLSKQNMGNEVEDPFNFNFDQVINDSNFLDIQTSPSVDEELSNTEKFDWLFKL